MDQRGDIIVAPATLTGGAIAIIRLSGEGCIALCDRVFCGAKGSLESAATHTLRYGNIVDGERIVDDVLVTLFRAPHSYTGEESVEISCHGSQYILQEIITLLISQGARTAQAGEFTTRAYLAGRMDLSQAEAVADMIASTSKAQHAMASTQMRGGYSTRLSELRAQLVELAALLELELDFSEEEVEFADRTRLTQLMEAWEGEREALSNSFAVGNAIKRGVQVAIIGEPNVGKSTLLNTLLGDQRAMVSDIAGTTRDLIEEEMVIDGITFRFIDTAGVHTTNDKLELMGIERTHSAIERAQIIIHLTDTEGGHSQSSEIDLGNLREDQRVIEVINKIDLNVSGESGLESDLLRGSITVEIGGDAICAGEVAKSGDDGSSDEGAGDEGSGDEGAGDEFKSEESRESRKRVKISAKERIGIEALLKALRDEIETKSLFEGAPIVSSLRHYELLTAALKALKAAQKGLTESLPTDLLCQEIREVLHNIGSITGSITTDDILGEIFSKFCIGK